MPQREFVYEYDQDTRILVRLPEDENTPVELFNNDDMTELPHPPKGSPLYETLLREIGLHTLLHPAGESQKEWLQ